MMRFFCFVYLIVLQTSYVSAGPREYFPQYSDPDLQTCLTELASHLTQHVDYTPDDVLREGSVIDNCAGQCSSESVYNNTREHYKTADRDQIVYWETLHTNLAVNEIKNIREGFSFNEFETMMHVTQICSLAVLEGLTWQSILN